MKGMEKDLVGGETAHVGAADEVLQVFKEVLDVGVH